MSIRALAKDVYSAKQKVERYEKLYEVAPTVEKTAAGVELKIAQKEFEMLKRMLDGEKESGEFRKKFSGFGSNRY
jgi:hypothetical protein